MKHLLVYIVGIAMLGAIAIASKTIAADDSQDKLDSLLKKELQIELGMQKLNEDERDKVATLLVTLARNNNLYDSAYAFMENQGFQIVTVHGTQKLKLHDWEIVQEYLIVSDRLGMVWACDNPIRYFKPGRYWADVKSFGVSRIIDAQGDEIRIFQSEQVQ